MSVRHLHDGPIESFYISKYNTKTITRMPAATLAALSWAAERAGQSYGMYTLNLTDVDQRRIQTEYEEWKAEERRLKAERHQTSLPRVDTDAGEAGLVISDDDV